LASSRNHVLAKMGLGRQSSLQVVPEFLKRLVEPGKMRIPTGSPPARLLPISPSDRSGSSTPGQPRATPTPTSRPSIRIRPGRSQWRRQSQSPSPVRGR
jgi:hypothetical protein